ncbi:MAG: YbjQ family protein [Deltaproteobacteria bacterium]|jgi:uncharacterized protein YbjQ (UPF0145 family)|nr:YbjQ family protein [Deltaproteobacteria bacterium]
MSFLITTTESADGYEIESYLGPLIVPSVGAGNFIKDWLARFTDFFGGKSRSYQKTYEKMLSNGLSEMTDQAKAHGANGILGLRVETTNISGGTSLISILVYGTAVVVRPIITTKC